MSNRFRIGAAALIAFGGASAMLPADAQDLQEALQRAYNNNPELALQRTQISRAGEQVKQAKSGLRPTLDATGSYTLQRNDTTRFDDFNLGFPPAPGDGGDDGAGGAIFNVGVQNVVSGQLRAEQPLYTGGRVRSAVRAAEAGRGGARAAFDAAQQDIFLRTIIAYKAVNRDRAAIRIRENSVALLQEQLRAATDRFDVGVITRTDVALAEARLEGAIAELSLAQAELEASKADFEFNVGLPPTELEPINQLPLALPQSFEEALEIARQYSPDLLAANYNVREAREGIESARAGLRPTLSIVGIAGIQETIGDFQDTNLSAAAQARIPLYQGGLLRSRVRDARLAETQAKQQVAVIDRQVLLNISRNWYAYSAARNAILASQKQVRAAELAYQGGQDELAAGVRTTLDVLDQEQDLLEAQLAVIDAEQNAFVAAHQLLRAMGQLTPDLYGLEVTGLE